MTKDSVSLANILAGFFNEQVAEQMPHRNSFNQLPLLLPKIHSMENKK
jgi:hypothetical protein